MTIWGGAGWEHRNIPRREHEFRSGWLQWALRDAAKAAGHYESAESAQLFWQTVADEINRACEDGRIEAGPPRRGLYPRWHTADLRPALRAWWDAFMMVVRFVGFDTMPMISSGHLEDIERFATLWRTKPVLEASETDFPDRLRTGIAGIYAKGGSWLALAGLLALPAIIWRTRRCGESRWIASALVALLGGIVALCLIAALVDVTSFPALHPMYLRSASPLFITSAFLIPLSLIQKPEAGPVHRE